MGRKSRAKTARRRALAGGAMAVRVPAAVGGVMHEAPESAPTPSWLIPVSPGPAAHPRAVAPVVPPAQAQPQLPRPGGCEWLRTLAVRRLRVNAPSRTRYGSSWPAATAGPRWVVPSASPVRGAAALSGSPPRGAFLASPRSGGVPQSSDIRDTERRSVASGRDRIVTPWQAGTAPQQPIGKRTAASMQAAALRESAMHPSARPVSRHIGLHGRSHRRCRQDHCGSPEPGKPR
jgi:hypothetical protein